MAECTTRREFVLPVFRTRPSGDFSLNDLVAGRIDLVARCIASTFIVSYAIRRSSNLSLCMFRGELDDTEDDQTGTLVEINGSSIRHLRPDERHIASALQWLLKPPQPNRQKVFEFRRHQPEMSEEEATAALVAKSQEVTQGMTMTPEQTFRRALDAAIGRAMRTAEAGAKPVLLLLDEHGAPAADIVAAHGPAIAQGCAVVLLGDNRGLGVAQLRAAAAAAEQSGIATLEVSLGPSPLLASQCIVLMQHYLDQCQCHVSKRKRAEGETNEVKPKAVAVAVPPNLTPKHETGNPAPAGTEQLQL